MQVIFSLGQTSVGFTFWGSNEPTNWHGIEHFLVFDAEGGSGLPEWDDKPVDYAQHYLVEYSVPEPATFLLLGLGGLVLRKLDCVDKRIEALQN